MASEMVSRGCHARQAFGSVIAILICASWALGQESPQELDVRPLPVGGMVERTINKGHNHIYLVEVRAGQALRLESSGATANLIIWMGSYDDERVLDVRAYSALGRTSLTFIPEKTGRYLVVVNAIKYTATNAGYRLTASVNTATSEDKERRRAEELLASSTESIIRGDPETLRGAVQKLEESLEFWTHAKESHCEGITRGLLGLQYAEAGEFGKAWEHLNRALLTSRAARDLHCEARVLNNLGLVYLSLGDTEKALDCLERARTLTINLGDVHGTLWSTTHLGLAFIDIGEPQTALEYFKRALQIVEESGPPYDKASIFGKMGKAYDALGDPSKLLEYSQKALPLFHAAGEYGEEAAMLNNIGGTYDRLGDTRKALGYFHEALMRYSLTINKRYEGSTFSNLMQACKSLRRPRLAFFYGKQAVNLYQEQRASAGHLAQESQQAYLKSVEDTYRTLSELLIEQGRLAEALQLLNSFKDQQYFDFDPSARKAPAPLTLSPREASFAEQYRQKSERAGVFGTQLEALRWHVRDGQPGQEEAAQIKKLKAEFEAASDGFSQLLRQAEAEFSRPLRRAQLALLKGKSETTPLPVTQGRAQRVQVLVDAARQSGDNTRAELVFVDAKNAMPFKKDPHKPFARPYYWSSFVLVGNWR